MALQPGTTLGPYEIEASLGAGGMGEVYTARDTRLDRTVAIKVLSEQIASDPGLKQRFEREAKTISSLNHPHICTLYDVGEHQGINYLVMEHLEGVSLAERLEQGPVPLDQALQISIELADALAAAHRQGIIHRDLKPGNVMLTKSGAKLLDFGLAKLKGADLAAEGLTALVTEDAPLTEQGTILGTFQYMAPEQLEGQDADTRTDIFAFGALVYELVTGKRAFEGKSRASLIAAILERQPPPISSLQTMSPAALDRIVTTCLAKDPDVRWPSASDVGRQLRWIAEAGASADGPAAAAPPVRTMRERLVWALAGGVVAAVVVGLSVWSMLRPEPALPTRLTVSSSGAAELLDTSLRGLELTPDGRTVVFIGCAETCDTVEQRQVFRRPLDQLDAVPIAGTEGAAWVSVSPDGLTIGFGDRQGVSTMPLSGGTAVRLYEGETFGGDLGSDGRVVVAGLPGQGLWLISSRDRGPDRVSSGARVFARRTRGVVHPAGRGRHGYGNRRGLGRHGRDANAVGRAWCAIFAQWPLAVGPGWVVARCTVRSGHTRPHRRATPGSGGSADRRRRPVQSVLVRRVHERVPSLPSRRSGGDPDGEQARMGEPAGRASSRSGSGP